MLKSGTGGLAFYAAKAEYPFIPRGAGGPAEIAQLSASTL